MGCEHKKSKKLVGGTSRPRQAGCILKLIKPAHRLAGDGVYLELGREVSMIVAGQLAPRKRARPHANGAQKRFPSAARITNLSHSNIHIPSMFETLTMAPPDAILGIGEAFKR